MGDTAPWDVIVVGAGVEGSAAAYHLARAGQKTLLLEQFTLPHTRGSSHGASRIIRKAYNKSLYANMMVEAYQEWDQLAREEKAELFKKTGLLYIGKNKENGSVAKREKSLAGVNVAYRSLNASQLKNDYPMLTFPEDHCAVFDPDAGVLMPDKCVAAFQNQFRRSGGVIRDGEPVTSVLPGEIITVVTSKSRYRCQRLVLTAGPWASKLLRPLGVNLPLKPVKIDVCYWAEKQPGSYASSNAFPTIIYHYEEKGFYGVPALEYPGLMKVCCHLGGAVDPDTRDHDLVANSEFIAKTAEFVRQHMSGLEDKPSIVEPCMYTMTPDDDFILDTHPAWKNIVIGAGFSGHGFKLAPIVGKVLGELGMGRVTSYNLHDFRINRFFPELEKSKL